MTSEMADWFGPPSWPKKPPRPEPGEELLELPPLLLLLLLLPLPLLLLPLLLLLLLLLLLPDALPELSAAEPDGLLEPSALVLAPCALGLCRKKEPKPLGTFSGGLGASA
jgi:hypothetical protein